MTFDEYSALHPEAAQSTYRGSKPDRGRLVVGRQYPDEGYAVVRCGNTEIQVGYTLLRSVWLFDKESAVSGDLANLQAAIDSIICEASLGRTGDGSVSSVP